jgi:hypothetical protein
MQDKRYPESIPNRRKAGYGQYHHGDTSRYQQHIYPRSARRNQEARQYAPENPGNGQSDSQHRIHLLTALILPMCFSD